MKEKETRETFSMRIPVALRAELQKRADAEGRTLTNYIIFLLKGAMNDGR